MVAARDLSNDHVELLLAKMDAIQKDLAALKEQQRRQEELIEEAMPILKLMLEVGSGKLESLEQRGYFAFGREILNVIDRIVTGFTPEDVTQLGENVVHILSAVKRATQPNMLAIADEATAAIESSGDAEPLNWRGMIRASRDEDVQRGLAAAVAVLRRVGKLAATSTERQRTQKTKLEKLLGPSRPAPKMLPPPAVQRPRPPPPEVRTVPGRFDADGFLADATTWTPDLALEIARSLGYLELTEAHWTVIEFARREFESSHKSPNVRKLSTALGGDVKQLYALFPKTPGKSAARIAGLPKPVGCI